jgi:hypothetical protein
MEFDGRRYPDLHAFEAEDAAVIERALAETRNPIHRAQYADFLWEWTEGKDFRIAQTAIDAYLELADLYLTNRWYSALADALDRASELALRLNDRTRIDRAKASGLRIADELVQDERHPVAGPTRWVLETLLEFGRKLADEERSQIVRIIEDAIDCYEHDGTGKRGLLELFAHPQIAKGDAGRVRAVKLRIAASLEAEARLAAAERGAIVGMAIYREAIDAYIEAGEPAKVDELKQLLGDAIEASVSEMKSVSATVTIPREEFERRTNWLLERDLRDALIALPINGWAIPAVERVRQRADKNRQRFPFQWSVSRVTVKDGRVVDAPETDDDIERSSFAQEYQYQREFLRVELSHMLDRLEAEKGLGTAAILDLLRQGGLVDEDTLATIGVGLDGYFAGDYVSALHVLVPQLEDVLRGFLVPLGVATTSVRDGLTREKPLEEVLRTPKLREVLGEDVTVFLEMLFTDQRGANMRNETAHGLLKARHCTRDRLHLVIFSYITIGKFTVTDRKAQPDEGRTVAGQ